jgi:hypothetical protein
MDGVRTRLVVPSWALLVAAVAVGAAGCVGSQAERVQVPVLSGVWIPDSGVMSVPILLSRPTSYLLSGDGSSSIESMKWRHWGDSRTAIRGIGQVRVFPEGARTWHMSRFSVTDSASRIRTCTLQAFLGQRGMSIHRVEARVYTRFGRRDLLPPGTAHCWGPSSRADG